MRDKRPPVVTTFDKWCASVALLVGLCINLTGIASEAPFDDVRDWLRLIVCFVVAFTLLGLGLARSRRYGNYRHLTILSELDDQQRKTVKSRRRESPTPDSLVAARSRYARARQETENRSTLLLGAVGAMSGAATVSTTFGIIFRIVAATIFLVGGAACLIAAERWRQIADLMAARLATEPGGVPPSARASDHQPD